MLTNQMYIGTMVQGRQRVVSYKIHDRVTTPESEWFVKEGTHEPIVDREDFDRAQDLLMRDTRTMVQAKTISIFTGYVRCIDCGFAMTRKKAKNHAYYVCSTYKRKSKAHCSLHSIREDMLTKAVLEAIKMQIRVVEDLAFLVDRLNAAPLTKRKSENAAALLEKHQAERERLRGLAMHLYVDWKSSVITKDEYLHMKEAFDRQIDGLSGIISTLEGDIEHYKSGVTAGDAFFSSFLSHKNITSLNRGILAALVDEILVHEDKEITVRFKFTNQFERVLELIEENSLEASG